MRVVARAGELTLAGQPVLVITDLAEVKASLYVPVRYLSGVRIGQTVALTADPYPGRTFSGTITSVNPKAEYTPRGVQSQRDRLNLMFGVTVRIDNRDGALLPGLPVQASIVADAAVN
jgi:HlyD family secretion protein